MNERKDVNIMAVAARVGARAPTVFDLVRESVLFDPERPHMGPNELAKEIREDPSLLNFGCPMCHKELPYELFIAHMADTKEGKGCWTRWYNTLDVTRHKYAGASIGDSNE